MGRLFCKSVDFRKLVVAPVLARKGGEVSWQGSGRGLGSSDETVAPRAEPGCRISTDGRATARREENAWEGLTKTQQ